MKKIISVLLILVFSFSVAYADGQATDEYMLENYKKALALSPLPSFNGYCAACVAYQGMAMGIHKNYVWCNGNEAYGKYSSMERTEGLWYTKSFPSSLYSMKDVFLSQNGKSGEKTYCPVVLGFNTGTASQAGQKYGHAMMIYAVKDGMVYFTDSTEPVISDNIHKLSTDDFCKKYSDNPCTSEREFNYDGAVVFYKAPPASATLAISDDKVCVWQDVTLSFSSPGATSYWIGIDKDGTRVMTLSTKEPQLKLSFGEEGTYTAYITACNVFGCVDSAPIIFTVGSHPQNAELCADKTSASLGEAIKFTYDADFATSFSIGILKPDGNFYVVHNDEKELIQSFDRTGTYCIFVSCCNSFGYVDTQKLEINITK